MTDSQQPRPKSPDRVEELPAAAREPRVKEVSETESRNVKGGAKRAGINDNSV